MKVADLSNADRPRRVAIIALDSDCNLTRSYLVFLRNVTTI
jgi:hypothetical protein